MIIMINNKFVKKQEANVPVTSSFGRGYGIFETLRTINNKELLREKKHIERLFISAKKINIKIKYSKNEILEQLNKVVEKSNHKLQRIKIIVIPEKVIFISTKQIDNHEIYKGVSCMSIKAKREMPEIKSISYLTSYLCHEKAQSKGYFDAILIDENEEVYECAYANLFWFEGRNLCTRGNQILPGITRQEVINLSPYEIKYKTIKLKELKKKKEVFLTSSIKGIVPITKIDKTKISTGRVGEQTTKLMQLLQTSSH